MVISWYWWVVTPILMIVVWRGKKDRILDSLITGYIFLLLVGTVFNRPTKWTHLGEFRLFWSYSEPTLRHEILLNYLLFIPYGCLMSIRKSAWKVIMLSGIAISLIVEVLQFVLKKGLFEFDDIIGNGIGCLIGLLLISGFRRIKQK